MPFTPFHLGPGLLLKGAVPARFSWTAFAAAQVLIDCETLYHILARSYPLHRHLHTFPGAVAAGLAAAGLLAALRPLAGRFRPPALLSEDIAVRPLFVGGLAGGLTHPFFDGLMHTDIRPFAPFSDANPFLGLIPVGGLHLACLAAGLAGAVWLWRRA